MKNLKLSELIKSVKQTRPDSPELHSIESDELIQVIPEEIAERIVGGANNTCTNSGCHC